MSDSEEVEMMVEPTDLKVMVVAEDMLARAGLAALLADQPGLAVVGQVTSGDDILQAINVFQPDVVVWDLGWEPSSSIESLSDLPDGGPPLVALLWDIAHVSEAWTGGARGILHRDASPASLTVAIAAVAQGLAVLEPDFASAMRSPGDRAPSTSAFELTPRESEVLRLLAEGMSNKSIAYELDISEHTVKFHVTSIMNKLNAQSRTEAVVNATRLGLVPL